MRVFQPARIEFADAANSPTLPLIDQAASGDLHPPDVGAEIPAKSPRPWPPGLSAAGISESPPKRCFPSPTKSTAPATKVPPSSPFGQARDFPPAFPRLPRPATRARVPPADIRGVRYFPPRRTDRKSTRLNSRHLCISHAVFCFTKNRLQNGETCIIRQENRDILAIMR